MAAFTSSDEFDLERRVWMTNETPPYDLYKALNSSMQTPFWKWLLGSSKVDYNLPYKVYSDTSKNYVHDTDSDEVYLKMTNGQISKDYGPAVSSNPNSANYNPNYNRIEIDGVVLPEFDLMLHEVYRYLETLYPDSPDERHLLTDNEFNDTVLAAGDMINYSPDVKFFDKVAETLAKALTVDEVSDESAKIKIRNLLNNSFRRKLYGSKAGYRMFANDIFQICTIFPVATYLPIKPVDPAIIAMEKNTLNNQGALDALNMTKKEYKNYARQHNRTIDTYSELYYRKFRLTDWDGQDSSYLQKTDSNTYVFGYSIPCNENRIYEYPNADDSSALLDNVAMGSTITNTLDDKGITYVNSVSDGIFETEVALKQSTGTEVYGTEVASSTKEIHYVSTSHANGIIYQNCFLYDTMKDLLDKIKSDSNYKEIYESIERTHNNHFKGSNESTNFFEAVYNCTKNNSISKETIMEALKPSNLKLILNPYVKGSLLMEPSKSISYYPDTVPSFEMMLNDEGDFTGVIEVHEDSLVDGQHIFNKYIGDTNLSEINNLKLNYLYLINNFTKGSIDYTFNEANVDPIKEIPTLQKDNRYAFIINTINNDKVVVFGNLKVDYAAEGSVFKHVKAHLNITNIPATKSDALMKVVYSDYNDILKAKEAVLDAYTPFVYVGMTTDGCADLVKLFNATEDAASVITSTDELAPSSFGYIRSERTYYFSTYKGELITLGENINVGEELALSLYKSASGLDYSEFILLYLENETYEETLEKYRVNREYMYENSSYSPDQSIDEDDWTVFEQSTIRPGCSIDKIVYVTGTTTEVAFSNTEYLDGTIDEYSLGYLNVLPVIDNGAESFNIYLYKSSEEEPELIEGTYDTYEYAKNKNITWPHMNYYSYEMTPHPAENVDLALTGIVKRVNFNRSAYTSIGIDEDKLSKSAADWLANAEWQNNKIVDNITIKPTSTTAIKIESVVNVENENLRNTISFESDLAKEYFKTLRVGDSVFGPTIDSDNENTYITSIGYNSVTVNREFTQSGVFVFTYNCKMNIISEDKENDMARFKKTLDEYDMYSITNPFEHGLWGSADFPHASNAILESLPDVSFYKPYNYISKGAAGVNSFNEVMDKIHPKRYVGDNFIRIPSTIKFMNDLFVELNITKVLPTTTRSGKTGALMSVDWLDYMTNSLKDISRATDKANVGVNLMMETDSSGYYTMDPELTYTDPNVQLKFITMNFEGIQPMWNNNIIDSDNEWTVPAYAQLGTGGSGRFSWFTSPADVTYPNIWGNNVFDSERITGEDLDELNKANGNLRKRSTWGTDDSAEVIDTSANSRFRSVEKPLFEIPLGEYDVQTRYLPSTNNELTRACTTIQSSFYAQTFSNLTKYMIGDTSANTGDVTSMPVVLNNNNIFDAEPIAFFSGIDKLTYKKYWTPTLAENDARIKYVDENSLDLSNIGNYYVIPTETILSNVGATLSTKKFLDHSIYIRVDEDTSILYEPVFMGTISRSNLRVIEEGTSRDTIEELLYHTLIGINTEITDPISAMDLIPRITDDQSRLNKIFWFVISDVDDTTFQEDDIGTGTIIGLVSPNSTTKNSTSDYKYVIFNRGYFTSTLSMARPLNITSEEYNTAIGNVKNTIEDLTLSGLVSLRTGIEYTNTSKKTIKLISNGNYIYNSNGDILVSSTIPEGFTAQDSTNVISRSELNSITEGFYKYYVGEDVIIEPGYTLCMESDTTQPKVFHGQSPIYDLSKGITEITLPRKCIAEGSYNFDYIIDAGITCTGYLYTSSSSNEISYAKSAGDENTYDMIENDNFDVISDEEITFNATRAAIYKDDTNNAFYTYTNKYTDSEGEKTFDELKKVAIKFEEQKYFKNTTHLSGVYKNVLSQASGSSSITETPTLREISDIGEFNTNLISANDRILRITPMDLRSVYSEYLEPVMYSNYYDVDGMVRGIDKDGNLVVSYDNTVSDTLEKFNFNSKLKSIVPVNKEFNDATQSFVTTIPEETYVEFGSNSDYTAPTVNKASVKFTKSIVSDEKAVSSSAYEFKYFKNLLVFRAAVAKNNPSKLIPASTDNGQFIKAVSFLQRGDKPVSGLALSSDSSESMANLTIKYNNNRISNVSLAYYDTLSMSFICVTSDNKVGLASNVNLPSNLVIDLDWFSEPFLKSGSGSTSFGENFKIKHVFSEGDNWMITITNGSKETGVYSAPHEYTAASNIIILTDAFQTYVNYNGPEEVIQLPSTELMESANSEGVITATTAYAKRTDLSIRSSSGSSYEIEPYAINYSTLGHQEGFFFADSKSDYAIYGTGRDVFIKSPVYITDSDGNYSDQLTKNSYWKYARIPLLNEVSYSTYQKIIASRGENGGYYAVSSLRDNILKIYESMVNLPKYVKKVDSKWTFVVGTTNFTGSNCDYLPSYNDSRLAGDTTAVTMLKSLEEAFGGVLTNGPLLSDIMDKYYPYFVILNNLHVMPWYKDGENIGISDFIKAIPTNGSKLYYYHNGTKFTTNSTKPTVTRDNASTYKEYLEGVYNTTSKEYELSYYGVGPYGNMTVIDTTKSTSEPLENIYGCDLSFDQSAPKKVYYSKDAFESSWYAAYLSNLATYGLMEDQTTEICNGDIREVLFTNDRIIFITSGGSVVYINKADTYKSSDLSDVNKWHTAELPDSMSYDYIKRSHKIIKTIKYKSGANGTFDIEATYATFSRPIYQIETIFSSGDNIILGGYIKSRRDIEATWEMDFNDYSDKSKNVSALSNGVRNAKFYFSTTPFIMYSNNGGIGFNLATIPELLPNYNARTDKDPVSLNNASHEVGYGILIDAATKNINIKRGTENLGKITSNITTSTINNLDLVIYDAIDKSGNLSTTQKGGLSVAGITYESPNVYKFYLEGTDTNRSSYGYVLEANIDLNDEADFDDLKYYQPEASIMPEATAYKVKYSRFTLYVCPGANTVSVSSNEAIDMSGAVLSVSPSEITMDGNIIGSSDKGGQVEVLVSFNTRLPVSVEKQKECINTEVLPEYFDEYNNCLVEHITEVSTSASADGMFNYRETLSEEDKTSNNFGYKSVSEDKADSRLFYDYDDTDTGDEIIYVAKEAQNSESLPIYLCTSDGNYINKSGNIVNTLSFYDILKSYVFSAAVLAKAAKPKYASVSDAKQDSSLRTEDATWKEYFDLNSIKSINRDYQPIPYTNTLENPENIEVLKKGNFIIKRDGKISVSTVDPANIKIGNDITTFNLRDVACPGKFYVKYNPESEIALTTHSFVYKTTGNVISVVSSRAGTKAGIRSEITFSDLMELKPNTCIEYVGTDTVLLAKGTYLINNCNGTYSVDTAKPEDGIDLGSIDVLDLSKVERQDTLSYQRQYKGDNYKIAANSYVLNINGSYKVQSNFQYDGIETNNVNSALNIRDKSFSKYTGDNVAVGTNSYILNRNGYYTISNEAPLSKNDDIDVFDIQALKDIPDNSYTKYTGNTLIISSGHYITNVDGKHYLDAVNPNELIKKTSLAVSNVTLTKLLDETAKLEDREYIEITGTDSKVLANNGDYIVYDTVYNPGFGIRKDPIKGLTAASSTIRSTIDLNDIKNKLNKDNKYLKYSLNQNSTGVSTNDYLVNTEGELEVLDDYLLHINNSANVSLDNIVKLADESVLNYTGTTDKTIVTKNNYICTKDGVTTVLGYSLVEEIGTVTLNTIASVGQKECYKYTGDKVVLAKEGQWICKDANGNYTVTDTVSDSCKGSNDLTAITLNDIATLSVGDRLVNASNNNITIIAKNKKFIKKDGSYKIAKSAEITSSGLTLSGNVTKLDPVTLGALEDNAYTYTGEDLILSPGQSWVVTESKGVVTAQKSNKNILSTIDINTIASMAKPSFMLVYAGNIEIGKNTCIIKNDQNIISLDDTCDVATTDKGTNISVAYDLNKVDPNAWCQYLGNTITLKKNNYVINHNNNLYTSVADSSTIEDSLTKVTYNFTGSKYTGSASRVIPQNFYITRVSGTYHIERDPISGLSYKGDLDNLDFSEIRTLDSIPLSVATGAYYKYVGTDITISSATKFACHKTRIFYGDTDNAIKLSVGTGITVINLNDTLDNNSCVEFIGTPQFINKDSYITKDHGILGFTSEEQLVASDNIATFDLNNIYSLANNTYAKYTGLPYTILKDSYFIHDGQNSTIEGNFPLKEASNFTTLNSIISNSNTGNYQGKIANKITLAKDTYFKNVNGVISTASASDGFYRSADVDTFDLNKLLGAPTSWFRKYTGPDIYFKNNCIISNVNNKWIIVDSAESAASYENIPSILGGIFSSSGTTYKFTNVAGYTLTTNSYISYNNGELTITEEKPDSVRLNNINATYSDNADEILNKFLESFVNISYDNFYIKYTGTSEAADIAKNAYIYKNNGKYSIDTTSKYVPFENDVNIAFDDTINSKVNVITALVNTTNNKCCKYTGETLSLPAGTYYFAYNNNKVVLYSNYTAGTKDISSSSNSLLAEISSIIGKNTVLKLVKSNTITVIEKDQFVYKSNNLVSIRDSAFLYGYSPLDNVTSVDFNSIYKMNNNTFFRYTGENYTLPTNKCILRSNGNIIISDNVAENIDPIEGNLCDVLAVLANLKTDTCVKFEGDTLEIPANKYLVYLNGEFLICDSKITQADDFETFDLRDVYSLSTNTYRKYTGEDFVVTKDAYIINRNGDLELTSNPVITRIDELSLKALSTMGDNRYFEYTGYDVCLTDMGLKVSNTASLNEDILKAIFYVETTDQEKLNSETQYLDSISPDFTGTTIVFDDRYELRQIGDSAIRFYFDRKLGYFPIKLVRYVEFKAKFGYAVDQATVFYTKKSMHDIDNANDTSMPNAITSIYLPQRGYGGTRLRTEANNSWSDELPWELDSEAFEGSHLVNKYGENVTLCDSLGREVSANRGEFPVIGDDIVKLPTADLAEGKSKKISLSEFAEVETVYSSINVYRPVASKKYIWTSQDEVFINVYANSGESQQLANVMIAKPSELTLTSVSNASVTVSFDGEKFINDSNFRIANSILTFTMPSELSLYPVYAKISVGDMEKIVKLDYRSGENNVYEISSIVPAFYNYVNNRYQIVSHNDKLYCKLGDSEIALQHSYEKPTTTQETRSKIVNLPLFEIEGSKTYFMYDPEYGEGSDWRSHIRCESYIGDTKVNANYITCTWSDTSTITCNYNDGIYAFTFDVNTLSTPKVDGAYLTLISDSFVVTDNSDVEFKVVSNDIENLYISGARGPIYMRKPSYPTFKDLILNKQYIIKDYEPYYNASTIKEGTDTLTDATFNLVETNGVTFTKKLPIDELNDGNSHFIRIEVLTQKTVPTTKLNCFDNDYELLDLSDISIFPPDRVYFNPKGYPSSPVKINNEIFNKENNIYYTDELFTNNNKSYIRECDIDGKFIKYVISNGEAVKTNISVATDNVNSIFIPYRPNYTSCKEWFEGEYYIKGHESNPFWQVINLTSKFDSVTQDWNQVLSLNKFEKVGKTIKQVAVSDDEAYVVLSRASFAEVIDDELRQYYNCDYLDLFEGKIRFIATEPTADMYDSSNGVDQIIKYGICATNTIKDTFHPSEDSEFNLPGYLQSSYTVNSRKNFANPNETDSAIVEVTELGIFNKSHVLIAYAVFPPIEYRSDTQHVSFTSFVKYGNCTVGSVE